MNKFPVVILMILTLANIVSGATIQGTVYDFSLEKIENAIIEINTSPAQRYIARNGSYSFNVPEGNYLITVKNLNSKVLATENLAINEEGVFTLDIITFLDIEEEQELFNDTDLELNIEIEEIDQNGNLLIPLIITLLVVLAILGSIYYKYRNKSKPQLEDENDLTNKVLEFIKKEGGRTTQKELRKNFPYSEAKISLVITELESKSKLEKIKRGRSNVIILKK